MYIKGKIKHYERIRWEATTILYGNINVCREVMDRKQVSFWWCFCRKKAVNTKQCIMFMTLLSCSRIHEEDISRSVYVYVMKPCTIDCPCFIPEQ